MPPKSAETTSAFQPNKWAESARKEAELLRNNAAKFGLDPTRLARGFMLQTIIEDDRNIFDWINHQPFKAKAGRQSGQALKSRLELELVTPELPEEIKEELSRLKGQITKDQINPWDLGKGPRFVSVYQLWSSARTSIEQKIKSSALSGDIAYYIGEKSKFDDLRRKA